MVRLIPRAVLFGDPERVDPALAPDGTRLGWLAPHRGVLNVWTAPVGAGGVDWDRARPVTEAEGTGVKDFHWTELPGRLLYSQDEDGDESWRLHEVDVDRGTHRDLTPFPGVQARLEAVRASHPDEVLIGLNKDNPELHDVYRLSLSTGEVVREVENPGFAEWVVDEDLEVRGAWAPMENGGFTLVVRDGRDDEWRPLLTVSADDAPFINAMAFTGDGKAVIVTSATDADTGRLTKVEIASGAVEVLFEDPAADVTDAVLHPVTRLPQIVTVLRDRIDHVVLDPELAADAAAIRALHPGDPRFLGRDAADRTWLIGFTGDTEPVTYYLYDRRARSGTLLFVSRPDLAEYELAAMEPFSFTARDGLTVHGYLSFPPGAERSGLPAVLNVHGGPQARDVWGYHPGAQWLANRGYLCVQVNYRGSTGYGKQFVTAGDREWGGRMQDDLLDAVEYVVAAGWVDPARVAIYGGSYGGYAALVGAAFTPDVFACAVDASGPVNLTTLLESLPPYWKPMIEQMYKQIGDPRADAEFLWSRSPLSKVRDIRIPLLISQGRNDPRVKETEAEQIVAALTEAGIEHEYLLFPDEGHGFTKPENRLAFYTAAERFLARHPSGRHED